MLRVLSMIICRDALSIMITCYVPSRIVLVGEFDMLSWPRYGHIESPHITPQGRWGNAETIFSQRRSIYDLVYFTIE